MQFFMTEFTIHQELNAAMAYHKGTASMNGIANFLRIDPTLVRNWVK